MTYIPSFYICGHEACQEQWTRELPHDEIITPACLTKKKFSSINFKCKPRLLLFIKLQFILLIFSNFSNFFGLIFAMMLLLFISNYDTYYKSSK